jgi:hypothetical protein
MFSAWSCVRNARGLLVCLFALHYYTSFVVPVSANSEKYQQEAATIILMFLCSKHLPVFSFSCFFYI